MPILKLNKGFGIALMNILEGAEVSCKSLKILLAELQNTNAEPKQYLHQVPYSLEYLLDQSNRVSWQVLHQLLDNVRDRLGYQDADFVRIGRLFEQVPFFTTISLIARAFFSLPEFYTWVHTASSDSPTKQTVSCIKFTASYDQEFNYTITMSIDDGYEEIPQFYLTSLGVLEVMPRLYGLPMAKVEMERIYKGCIYTFQTKDVGGWFSLVRRLFTLYLAPRKTAAQLRTAQAELHQKNVQLVQENKRLRDSKVALKVAIHKAEAASMAKSEFLHNISHEIRTPMNGILGATSLLQNLPMAAEQVELVEIIQDSTESLLGMLNDILDLAKIESGKTVLKPSVEQPAKVLSSVYNLFKALADKKGIQFYLIVGQGMEQWITIDGMRLKQLLVNLVSNAIKFTERGAVTLYGVLQNQELHLSVADTGVGIHEADQRIIFESFTQAESGKVSHFNVGDGDLKFNSEQGTGLGLSIVDKLVTLMGGALHLRSKPAQGTLVDMHFPVTFAAAAPSKPVADDISNTGGQRLSVLVVEDNRVNRMVMNKQLEKLGHEVDYAENGRDGVDKALHQHFDLILMDIMMPVMNGIDAAREIRQHYSAEQLPIVAVSANISEEDLQTYTAAGINESLAKPLKIGQLNQVLKNYQQPGAEPSPKVGNSG